VPKQNKHKPHRRTRSRVPSQSFGTLGLEYVLESGSVKDIERYRRAADAVAEFHWRFYAELAFQRSLIETDLIDVISRAANGPYPFNQWQRAVKWKYSLDPLNTRGSVLLWRRTIQYRQD